MDEIVTRAMAKWPNVPAVYGWLALDSRGQWLIKGERIGNPGIVEFIGRNYEHDDRGRWFFQNGPQRVFVALHYTPFVFRYELAEGGTLTSHNARAVGRIDGCWIDETGRVLLATDVGVGTIDDRDLDTLAGRFTDAGGGIPDDDALTSAIEDIQAGSAGRLYLPWRGERIAIEPIRSQEVGSRFGIVLLPQPDDGEEACT